MITARLLESRTIFVQGGLSDFAQADAEFSDLLDRCAIRGRARTRAELVFEEVVTNVIRHAYGGDDSRLIEVHASCDEDTVRFLVTDDGPAFDPLAHPDPEPPTSLDGEREGGLGLFLVRKLAAHLSYCREEGRNRLLVVVATPTASA